MPVTDRATGDKSERSVTLDKDEGNRPDTSLDGLAALKPVFKDGQQVKEGRFITAGNASQLSDGASAAVLMEEKEVERRGLGPMAGCPAPVIDHAGLEILTVAEGVEDALAAWVLTTYPAWAALSAGNMAALNLPAQFRQVIICADAEPVGIDAARKLASRLRTEGREARVLVPEAGKDANDVLRARAA